VHAHRNPNKNTVEDTGAAAARHCNDRYRDGWDVGPGAGGRHCHQAVTA